jgi:acyl carrier protein
MEFEKDIRCRGQGLVPESPAATSARKEAMMAVPTFDDVRKMVAEKTGLEMRDVTIDSTLEDLGMESKDLTNLLSDVEKKYGIKMNRGQLEKTKNLGSLYKLVIAP